LTALVSQHSTGGAAWQRPWLRAHERVDAWCKSCAYALCCWPWLTHF